MGSSGSKPSEADLLPFVQQITQEHESVEDKTVPKLLSKKELKVAKQVCRSYHLTSHSASDPIAAT
jgi:hypothetical protein